MGSRGFGATKRDNSGRLGSVSDYCVRHCVCPVVVVRYPEEKDGGGGAEPVVCVASAVEDEEEEEPEYHDATDHRKEKILEDTGTCLLLDITSWNSTEDSVNCRLFLLLLIFHDTILQGQSVTTSTTITSSGNVFELGFFTPGYENSTTGSYLGIWYKRVSERTVVWVANRDYSLPDSSAVLTIASDGNLVIQKGSFSYMLSNISSSGNTSATLLDSGNLMPEMRLNYVFNYSYVSNDNGSYFTYSVYDPKIISRLVLDTSGQVHQLTWLETTGQWNLFWSQPRQRCYVNPTCGAFGACNASAILFCQCLRGFEPNSAGDWNAGDTSGGCVRKAPLRCGNDSAVKGQKDQFLRVSKVTLPANSTVLSQVRSVGDCQSACFSNCSCSAYTYSVSGCSIWGNELLNVELLMDDDPEGKDFYLRLAASEFPSQGKGKWIIPVLVVPMTLLATVSFFYCWRRRKSQNKGEDLVLFDLGTSIGAAGCKPNEAGKNHTGKKKEVDLPLFSFASVSAATDNFCDANKLGEGGFGPVYKGKLQKGYEVAVKRLSKMSGQGLEELQNEAMLIAKLQHNNLVRLLGCCIEKDEKILIYEFMPNKSLDFFLFGL
ncbi:hypothetical protein RHMOL_Rhmol04G0031200 [Rhododendron molle]|uniref:Uncharacterized protein n=1 Tax=Rhododendron molle TaxID=49168 RepID=A0ACC0NWT4_RHOML|nr:hypothetical protein RHMOL_Rhmol04G0031200 [Rhododendron molle]